MADNITYRFIQNVGDYFPSGYFTEDFVDKVQKIKRPPPDLHRGGQKTTKNLYCNLIYRTISSGNLAGISTRFQVS